MTWIPISGTLPQYSTADNDLANDYYLKFYQSGTTTAINMATDSTGGTTLAKCALSADGYPITNPLDDSTKFIPHIDQNYRIVLYTNETDADNNTTANAAFNIDGMVPQIAPSADAADITLRDTTVEAQDDYDRSPLFTDGDGFTAGAGPHVITVPSDWTPSGADARFYRVDNSGIVTALTPTATTTTTFTLAETLLSTDTIFIGDDDFRDQYGKATATNMSDGDAGPIPDCETIRNHYGEYDETTLDMASDGSFTDGDLALHKVGKMVTIYATSTNGLLHSSVHNPSSSSGVIPSKYRPSETVSIVYNLISSQLRRVSVSAAGTISFLYTDEALANSNRTSTGDFSITYIASSKG